MGCGAVEAQAAQKPSLASAKVFNNKDQLCVETFDLEELDIEKHQKFYHQPKQTIINTSYRIKELIGKGSYGEVYRCEETETNKQFALKVVKITANNKDSAIRQINSLKGEISVLRKLNHPNIIKYFSFDVSPDSDSVQIVFELVEQGSLKDYLKAHGPLTEAQAAKICKRILQGLQYLHSKSIVHRDLKCANILLTGDNTPKITDFGTAKQMKVKTNEDIAKLCASLKGTPYYMAPEILKRSGHHQSADIWSFGCTLIELLTGQPPWVSLTKNFEEIISYIISGIHPPLPKNVSKECEYFLKSCLNSVQSERLTAQELLQHQFITKHSSQENSKASHSIKSGFTNQNHQQTLKKVRNHDLQNAEFKELSYASTKKGVSKYKQGFIETSVEEGGSKVKRKLFSSKKSPESPQIMTDNKDSLIEISEIKIKPKSSSKAGKGNAKTAGHLKMTQENLAQWEELEAEIINMENKPSKNKNDFYRSPQSFPIHEDSAKSINTTKKQDIINTSIAQRERKRLEEQIQKQKLRKQEQQRLWQQQLNKERQILKSQTGNYSQSLNSRNSDKTTVKRKVKH